MNIIPSGSHPVKTVANSLLNAVTGPPARKEVAEPGDTDTSNVSPESAASVTLSDEARADQQRTAT